LFTPLIIFISKLAAAFADLPLPSFSVQSLFDAFPSSGSESPSAGTTTFAGYLRVKDVFATGMFTPLVILADLDASSFKSNN
jgi:hypothetical protein